MQNLNSSINQQEVTIQDYIGIFMRRRKTFFTGFLAVFLGVALYTFFMTPVYEASATLHVKDEKAKQGLLGELMMSEQNPVETEIEIIKSRTNAEKVVKRLHLDWQISKKSKNLDFQLLEFTSTAKEPRYKVELTGPESFKVYDDANDIVGEGKSGVLMQGKGVDLLVNGLSGKEGDTFVLTLLDIYNTAEGLRNRIKAAEIGNKTAIVKVSYTNTNAALARDVVNTLAQVYLEQNVGFKSEEALKTEQFVDQQLKAVRAELDASEEKIQAYKKASGIVDLDQQAKELIIKVSEFEKGKVDINLQKRQMEFAISAIDDAVKKGKVYSPAVMTDDPVVAGMVAKLAELETQRQGLLSQYTENHPAVHAVQSQIDELYHKIRETFETSLNNLSTMEKNMTKFAGKKYESELARLPAAEQETAKLLRYGKVNADTYTFLLQKREEARIAGAATVGNIDIIDPAIIPDRPIKPKKIKNLLLGLLVGCMVGGGLIMLQEHLDDTIKDAESTKRLLGIPFLAMIPYIVSKEKNNGNANGNGNKRKLIVYSEPKAAASEAFRSLRTAIHFSAVTQQKKTLLVTSTFPGEGKSTIIANMAASMAQTGAKVLLLDCDMRRPSLHAIFEQEKVPGLSEVLVGDIAIEETVHNTQVPGLDFVCAGTTPPNPSELLGSLQMSKLLDSLKDKYDYVLLDAPPALAVTDAPLLAGSVNMVILVIEIGRVPMKAAQRMRDIIQGIGAPLAGFVINGKSARSELYGYGYGYGYKYGYGYGNGNGHYGEDEKTGKEKKTWLKKLVGAAKEKVGK
jgi:tyrosine-protein kinase Etk/Wzc